MVTLLKAISVRLNDEYFDGKTKINEIRWMKNKSTKVFGRYNSKTRVIEVNPILTKSKSVMEFVIYHELCHASMIFRKKQHRWHTKRFWNIFNKYVDFDRYYKEYLEFIKNYWVSIGLINCDLSTRGEKWNKKK